MFSVGQNVVFGTDGVCVIKDKIWMKIDGTEREYYVLCPAYDEKSTIYSPVDNGGQPSRIRAVITEEEINDLLKDVSEQKMKWIADDNDRKELCDSIIKSGDRKALMLMIEMLYVRREEQKANKRRFRIVDDNYLKKAESILNCEFAFVLGIAQEDVPAYIVERIKSCKGE